MSRPTGRPPGLSYETVIVYLAENKATGAQIAKATGLSSSAVWGVILRLRRNGSPLLANLLTTAPEPPAASTADVVSSALLSRTPLEMFW